MGSKSRSSSDRNDENDRERRQGQTMTTGILGKKLGMSQVFDTEGKVIPVRAWFFKGPVGFPAGPGSSMFKNPPGQ
jgi:hypothetical protein